mmetsp:Transcript_22034/g.50341  ORF Transcript_22034/g.50341 Transcript_22034/m.50341 type:complete len:682 (+) Transcript_22034:47-2092(+)
MDMPPLISNSNISVEEIEPDGSDRDEIVVQRGVRYRDSYDEYGRRRSRVGNRGLQDILRKELGSVRQSIADHSDLLLAQVERACLEAVSKMEATITDLRGQNTKLQGQLKMAEEKLRNQHVSTAPASPLKNASAAGLSQVVRPFVPKPSILKVSEPLVKAPKMDIPGQIISESEGEEVIAASRDTHLSDLDARGGAIMARPARRSTSDKGKSASSAPRSAVFADASSMKEKVKEAVMQKEYNVMDFYKQRGLAQLVARSPLFDNITLFVVALNSFWISYDTDNNQADVLMKAEPIFQIVENLFCAYFTGELVTRFCAFEVKKNSFRDYWFIFDFTLVVMMVVETWVMTLIISMWPGGSNNFSAAASNASILKLAKLMRLTRMARMVRLLRALPELMVLLKGLVAATRSVFFTLCLLGLVIYVFALLFVQLMQAGAIHAGPEYDANFKSVPDAMYFLLLRGTLPDLADHVYDMSSNNILFAMLFLIFVLLASLTLMNMLVGVLVDVVSVVSAVEKEHMTVQWVKVKLLEMLESTGFDDDGNLQISKQEFETLLLNPKAAKMVQEVGVDVVGLVDFADFIFQDGQELSFPEFMELVLQLRGSNTATVKDIVELRKFVSVQLHSAMQKVTSAVETNLDKKIQRGYSKTFLPDVKARPIHAPIQAHGQSRRHANNPTATADETEV